VGHQEGDGELMRCARQGGEPIQIGIAESHFESISGSSATLPSNMQIGL
jgi:hypothetical protein